MHKIKIAASVFVFALLTSTQSACAPSASNAPSQGGNPAARQAPLNNAGAAQENRTEILRFYLLGDDAIDISKAIDSHFKTDSDKNHHHTFFHPNSRDQFLKPTAKEFLDNQKSTVHEESKFKNIAQEMGKTLKEQTPKKVILFIEGHGAFGGNYCYESRKRCTGTADVFFSILKTLDEKNKELAADHQLEHLLLVPLICYNQALFQKLFTLIATRPDWSFDISSLHMTQPLESGKNSSTHNLTQGRMGLKLPLGDQSFMSWATSTNTLQLLANLTTLDEYVELRNRKEHLNSNAFQPLFFETEHVSSVGKKVDVNLRDFGFKMIFSVELFLRAMPSKGLLAQPLPQGLSTKQILDQLVPQELHTQLLSLRINHPTGGLQSLDLNNLEQKPVYKILDHVECEIDLLP